MVLVYKYSQLSDNNKISYAESLKLCKNKKNFHLGQLKLFFTELLFLAMYAKPKYKVLYIGAAEGYHITKLADLFPDVYFDLWDPRKIITEKRDNIRIYNEFFTNTSANSYAQDKENVLLMCDIRNTTIFKSKKMKDIDKIDEIVDDDMKLQRTWCQIINPLYAYLKFRLPYMIPKTKYLTGTIFLQPYSKISTEARLLTNNYNDNILYDNIEFEEKMAYHNAFNRCNSVRYKKWQDIMEKYNLVNNWDNALALHITHYYLQNIKNIDSKEKAGELFMDIVNYHIKKYGDKYNILFNDQKH